MRADRRCYGALRRAAAASATLLTAEPAAAVGQFAPAVARGMCQGGLGGWSRLQRQRPRRRGDRLVGRTAGLRHRQRTDRAARPKLAAAARSPKGPSGRQLAAQQLIAWLRFYAAVCHGLSRRRAKPFNIGARCCRYTRLVIDTWLLSIDTCC